MTDTGADSRHLDDLRRLRRVRDRMDREYATPLNLEILARDAHMSAGHLSRQFRAAYGESPYAYLMTRRIERAMALLRGSERSVTEICFTVGCSSLGTFSTRFSELTGLSPSVPSPAPGRPSREFHRPERDASRRSARPRRQHLERREASTPRTTTAGCPGDLRQSFGTICSLDVLRGGCHRTSDSNPSARSECNSAGRDGPPCRCRRHHRTQRCRSKDR